MSRVRILSFILAAGLGHAARAASLVHSIDCAADVTIDLRSALSEEDRAEMRRRSATPLTVAGFSGLPTDGWARRVFAAYVDARARALGLTERERERLDNTAVLIGTFYVSETIIELPPEFAHTVVSDFIGAHVVERRLRRLQVRRLGLPDVYATMLLAADAVRTQAAALRAEWDFANGLSEAAADALAEKLAHLTDGHPSVAAMRAVHRLSLSDYVALNRANGRGGPPPTPAPVKSEASAAPTGTWQIPRAALPGPLARYEAFVRAALPGDLEVDLAEASAGLVALRVVRAIPARN